VFWPCSWRDNGNEISGFLPMFQLAQDRCLMSAFGH
jgi:hypothetical protein